MPASLAHMLIAQRVRDRLLKDSDTQVAEFAADVLKKHPQYMELGSLGPDLPYFGPKSLINPHKPIGVVPVRLVVQDRLSMGDAAYLGMR